jgi:cation:H+ antiporter
MVMEYFLFILGLVFLVKGAGLLVDASSSLAKKLNVSTLIIGLTVVAFGTSLPELMVNIFAALQGATDVAFGNIIGSNIANILLVLGAVALISPIKVGESTVWKEIPFALLAVVVLFVVSNYLLIDNIVITTITRVSGLMLLLFFTIFIYYVFGLSRKKKPIATKKKMEIVKHGNYTIAIMIILGLVGLFWGGKWVVEGAVFVAQQFGLSEFLISATIIAIGTSLPELVTGITAAKRKDVDLAVGNSIGSNIFNIFWILGITAVIAPVVIPSFINLDILILGAVTFLLFIFMFIGKKHEVSRWKGVVFILLYIAYMAFLIIRG